MRSNIELFTDYFAHESNPLTRTDGRIKLVFFLATLALVLASTKIFGFAVVTIWCVVALLMVKTPFKVLLARFAGPLLFVGVIILLQGLLFDKSPDELLKLGARVVAGVSLLVFLSVTTPMNQLLSALKSFRVPDAWLEIVAFTYRYIFVFIEEAQNIMDSQRLRLGYRGLRNSLRSWGVLVGSLLIRAYDQANATHSAMLLRGYSGQIHIQKPGPLTLEDKGIAMALATYYLVLLTIFIYGG